MTSITSLLLAVGLWYWIARQHQKAVDLPNGALFGLLPSLQSKWNIQDGSSREVESQVGGRSCITVEILLGEVASIAEVVGLMIWRPIQVAVILKELPLKLDPTQ